MTMPSAADPGLAAGRLPLCCPLCKGPLEAEPDRYRCRACPRDYPIILGIPDFRVFPDPYIDYADDHAKAHRLLADADGLSFAELSERYWAMTPDVAPALARRFVRHTLGGIERGRISLDVIRRVAAGLGAAPHADGTFLEVGCGTGGFLVAAAERYDQVVGIDIAFRWLVLARKRVAEAVEQGTLSPERAEKIQILCCCAEYLPFPDHRFDLVVGSDVIEHTPHQEQLLEQSRRALRPGGLLFLATPNRFSLTPEPHVQVWGVGFLPRRWMPAYVRLVRGVPYEHIRQLSSFELVHLLRRVGFERWRIVLPRLSPEELRRYSRFEQAGVAVYHRLSGLPVLRELLMVFGPFFNVVAVAPAPAEGGPRAAEPATGVVDDGGPGPRVLTPEYYRRLRTLEEGHGWFRGMRALASALLDPLAHRRASWDILDAGCGTGSLLGRLRRFPNARVVGIDLSPDALRFCRRRGDVSLARGSVLGLPVRDRSFDLAVCTDVLQHLAEPGRALAELYRVLRPGGYLLVRTNNRPESAGAGHASAPYQRYTVGDLIAQITEAGFVVERTTPGNFLPSLIEAAGRKLGGSVRGLAGAHAGGNGHAGDGHADHDAGLRLRPRSPRLRWIDDGLACLLTLEAWYVRALRRSLPAGTSLVLLARRPA